MLAGSAVHARGLGRCALLCFVALFPSLAFGQAAAGGQSHSLLATPAGDLYAWGWNNSGQIGDGTSANRHSPTLVLSDVVGVAAGSNHSAALRSDGTVWTWGHGSYGQLGHGNYNSANIPTRVPNLSGVTAIVSGARFTLALKSDGTVWGWGLNNTGQLGDGTTTTRATPALVSNLSGITGIAARGDHALALTSNGSVYGWGANNYGQVGDGTTVTRTSPVLLSSLSDVIEISAGDTHCLARTSAGVVYAWGGNGSGQLATGNTANKSTPTEIASPGAVRWLTAGGATSHGTLLDGGVKGWGANSNGEIGDTTTTQRTSPVVAATPPLVMLLESGGSHSLAITDTGEVWAWGSNTQGQLGDGTTTPRSTPVRIAEAGFSWPVAAPTFSVPAGTYSTVVNVIVASATAGADIHYTLTGADPTVSDPLVSSGIAVEIAAPATLKARAWKEGSPASAVTTATYSFAAANPTFTPGPSTYTTPKTVTLASTSPGATVHYTLDGSTPTTSSPVFGTPISIQTTTTLKAVAARDGWNPSAVVSGTYTMNFGSLSAPVISPASGTYDGLALVSLTADPGATIRYTTNGSLVTTTSTEYSGPFTVEATSTVNAKAFRIDYATSAQTSAAYTITVQPPQLSPAGGTHQAGQVITVASPTPGAIVRYTLDGTAPTASSVIVPPGGIVAGKFTLKAIATKPGATSSAVVTETYEISSSLGAPRVAAGENFSLALRSDGVAWAWGYNGWGQLGDNTTSQRNLPVIAGALSGISSVATGDGHSLAVRTDGSVVAWGANTHGQLGDGTTTARYQPVAVQGLSDVAEIDGGNAHTLALLTDGTVRAWGRNAEGQLGDGTTTQRLTPTEVSTLSNVAHVSAGYAHSLALLDDGTLWAWGTNGDGQLGLGDLTARSQPVQIASLSSVAMVSAGSRHTVALLTDGTVRAWGHNASGQLGDGSTTQRNAPVLVPGLTNIVAIAAGTQHTLALAADGTVWACGQNMNGQVGDGTGVQRNSPVAIQGLPTIAAIAAGTQHSLAIATDGSVWAWGRNHTGAIGDGTTTNRLSPVQIADGDMNWSVPAPILSLASGTYSTTQSVTITSQTPGATLRYTTDGTDPNPSSATISSGSSLPITVNTTLKARAYAPEAAASGIVVRNYVLRPTSPTFSPPAGTYTAGQSVTIATTTPDATIRYTLDGSLPTEASSAYAAPIAVETTQTLRAIAFRDGWSSSNVAGASYTMNFGTLTAPTISPSAGLYEYGQIVSMSAEPGTEIRYTTNGSAPGPGSTLYTGPIALQSAVTITAKAFQLDYAPSAATSRSYSLRANAPVLSPGAGTYAPSQQIAMTSATPGTTIHYTTTGADPTSSDPSVANGGTIAMGTFTLKARAFHGSMAVSDVTTGPYEVDGCTMSISPTSISRTAHAGGGTLTISAIGTSCGWTATSNAAWLVPGARNGTGADTLSFTVAPNATGVARTAALSIGEHVALVTQYAAPTCSIQVSPTSITATAQGATGSISVTASDDQCEWSASTSATWLSFSAPGAVGAYASTVLADQPVGYWRLNEEAGGVALDSTAHERHGTFAGGVVFGVASGLGDGTAAVAFDGSTAAVEIPHHASFDTPAISWEAWIKVDATSTVTRRILGSSSEAFSLAIEDGETEGRIAWKTAAGSSGHATVQAPIVGAGWTHFVFTYDGTNWHVYINGIERESGILNGGLATSGDLLFGRSAPSSHWYDGAIDEVARYGYAMTAAQVAHHFATRVGMATGSIDLEYAIAENGIATARNTEAEIGGRNVSVSQAADGASAPPTITARVSPAANVSGWHAQDVLIEFLCQDDEAITSCSPSTTVGQEGSDLSVTGVAQDADGSQTSIVVPLKIDLTDPTSTVISPESGMMTTASAVIVRMTAEDALSGILRVLCDEQDLFPVNGEYACEVDLRPGVNTVLVDAIDYAGNTVSQVLNYERTGPADEIRASPRKFSLLINEKQRLSVLDNYGRKITGATWTTSDELVAVVESANGRAEARGVGAGTATLVALWEGLTASLEVTVYSGGAMVPGTIKWSTPPQLAGSSLAAIEASTEDGIHFVGWEPGVESGGVYVGLGNDGAELWRQPSAGGHPTIIGDAFGGVLAVADGAITRIPVAPGQQAWRYKPSRSLRNDEVVQNRDGMIFLVEHDPDSSVTSVVLLDGETGTRRGRVALPTGTSETLNSDCQTWRNYFDVTSPGIQSLVIGNDDAAYLPFTVSSSYYNYLPCGYGSGSDESASYILRVSPSGAGSFHTVAQTSGFRSSTHVGAAVVTSAGTVVAEVSRSENGERVYSGLARVSSSGATVTSMATPFSPSSAGENGRVYGHTSSGFAAVNPQSGSVVWTRPDAGTVIGTTDDGVVILQDFTGLVRWIDATGQEIAQVLMPSEVDGYWERGLWVAPVGMILGNPIQTIQRGFAWLYKRGSLTNQGFVPRKDTGVFVKGHTAFEPFPHRHASVRLVPVNTHWRNKKFMINGTETTIFVNQDEMTTFFATLGASPGDGDTSPLCGGTLISGVNRPSDVGNPALDFERLDIAPSRQMMKILSLLQFDQNYDDDLPYACIPPSEGTEHNSNSFAAGILNAADLLPVRFVYPASELYPGWFKPVPKEKFQQ